MKILFTSFLLLLIKVNCIKFKFSSFRINLEKVEVLSFDKDILDINLKIFKYNRTIFASNASVTVKQDISRETIVKVRTYEFLTNEYKPFAVNLQKKFCAFIEEEYSTYLYNDFNKKGSHLFPKKCPTPKGKYILTNYVPNSGNYPIELPFKKFMIDSQVFYRKRLICHFRYYLFLDHDAIYRELFG